MAKSVDFLGSREKGAVLSNCRLYRYCLIRTWDNSLPYLVWCMLNPSTADHEEDDPTIKKCVGFAKRWGYGGIIVVNLFAWRATDCKELRTSPDPVGPRNRKILWHVLKYPTMVAWGNNLPRKPISEIQKDLVSYLATTRWCLGRTKSGEPRHPLMLSYKTSREPWSSYADV